jgi:hypothetical protein
MALVHNFDETLKKDCINIPIPSFKNSVIVMDKHTKVPRGSAKNCGVHH